MASAFVDLGVAGNFIDHHNFACWSGIPRNWKLCVTGLYPIHLSIRGFSSSLKWMPWMWASRCCCLNQVQTRNCTHAVPSLPHPGTLWGEGQGAAGQQMGWGGRPLLSSCQSPWSPPPPPLLQTSFLVALHGQGPIFDHQEPEFDTPSKTSDYLG